MLSWKCSSLKISAREIKVDIKNNDQAENVWIKSHQCYQGILFGDNWSFLFPKHLVGSGLAG